MTTPKVWADGPAGNTPITAAELNRLEANDAGAARNTAGSGLWYTTPQGALNTSVAVSTNNLHFTPLFLSGAAINRLGVRVSTVAAAASGGVIRMGLYGTTAGKPGSLLLDAGTISTEGAVGPREIAVTLTPAAGLYWFAAVPQVAGASFTAVTSAQAVFGVGMAAIDIAGANGFTQTISGTAGTTLPATATPGALTANAIRGWVRVA